MDEILLTKKVVYRRFKNVVDDAIYTTHNKDSYDDFNIKVQCTIQRYEDRYVREGILKEGDLSLFTRYEYTEDNSKRPITPPLVPKKADKLKFLDRWFVIKSTMPLTGEDDGIIGWECTAGQSNE